jgi:uncharacterized protein (TIGR03086 family)
MTQPTALAPELVRHGRAALAGWRTAAGHVTDADLDRATPCAEFSVADLVDHVQHSMLLLATTAGSRLEAAPGRASLAETLSLGEAALAAWEVRGIDGAVPVGSRTLAAEQAHAIVLMELAVHGWDLARAMNASAPELPDELLEYLLAQARLLITPDRRGRGFAAAVPVADDARLLDQLVAFTGRTP